MTAETNAEEQKYDQMTEAPIAGVIGRLAVPTIVAMLVTSVYNMADTYFVSQIGTSASGAVGVVLSLMTLIQAVGFTLGMGSGNMIARMLGKRREEEASVYVAVGFFTALIFGVLLAVGGLCVIDRLAVWLGSTETILPYATAYMRYILLGAPFMAASFTMNGQLRFQGNAFFSMLGIGFGGVLNMALDPLFIFTLKLGIAGAAIATVLSQFISFCILLYFSARKKALVPLRLRFFRPSGAVYRNIMRMGLPSLFRQGIGSFATILLNNCAMPYGDAAIAAMGIVNRVMMFLMSALLGFGQGYQPVCGYCYGAKKFSRIREGFFFCVKVATVFLLALAVVVFVFAPQIITVFRREDLEVIAIGTRALRFECFALPFYGFYIMNNMLTQTLGRSVRATVLACARQGIFFMPLILALPAFLGLTGLMLAQPAAEILSALLALLCCRITLRELNSEEIAAAESEAAHG